ncbi:MAG: MurR/RpiR family transcriptional regulator, partial [Christensenellaceae bacterium]
MAESVFDRIALLRQRTTKQERAIIDCLSNNNITNLSYLSITEFASLANVAESTLLRFCRKLGLRGYSEFRMLLAQSNSNEYTGDAE